MKMVKKLVVLMFVLALVSACAISAYASEVSATPPPVANIPDSVNNSDITRDATTPVQFTLGVNNFQGTDTWWDLDGTEVLSFSVLWAPRSQFIKIGVRNYSTGLIYDTGDNVVVGGDYEGRLRLRSKNVPAGRYQIVVINPYGSIGTVSGSASYWWD